MKTENTIKKLGPSAKAAKTRNSFRRALYRANKIIGSKNSYRKKEFSMKEFKREYTKFGKRTGMIKGKNLDKDLKTFVDYYVNKRTPDQCKAAADNLMKHLNNAVRSLNRSKGGIETIIDTNQRYIQVLIQAGALKTENKDDKKVYSIIKEKVPNKEDLLAVNDKYIKFKRIIIEYFGDGEEYAEAYGS